jgi:hypothetical protein
MVRFRVLGLGLRVKDLGFMVKGGRSSEMSVYLQTVASCHSHYRGTSLRRKRTPLGPYLMPMPRVLGGSRGGERFLIGEKPLYTNARA